MKAAMLAALGAVSLQADVIQQYSVEVDDFQFNHIFLQTSSSPVIYDSNNYAIGSNYDGTLVLEIAGLDRGHSSASIQFVGQGPYQLDAFGQALLPGDRSWTLFLTDLTTHQQILADGDQPLNTYLGLDGDLYQLELISTGQQGGDKVFAHVELTPIPDAGNSVILLGVALGSLGLLVKTGLDKRG